MLQDKESVTANCLSIKKLIWLMECWQFTLNRFLTKYNAISVIMCEIKWQKKTFKKINYIRWYTFDWVALCHFCQHLIRWINHFFLLIFFAFIYGDKAIGLFDSLRRQQIESQMGYNSLQLNDEKKCHDSCNWWFSCETWYYCPLSSRHCLAS